MKLEAWRRAQSLHEAGSLADLGEVWISATFVGKDPDTKETGAIVGALSVGNVENNREVNDQGTKDARRNM